MLLFSELPILLLLTIVVARRRRMRQHHYTPLQRSVSPLPVLDHDDSERSIGVLARGGEEGGETVVR